MSTNATPDTVLDEEEIERTLKGIARHEAVLGPDRSPLLRTPGDHGLEFHTVWFPSQDGVPLEAWYIPCEGSNKLIIANHPRWFNRYGLPSHLEPWKSGLSESGNDVEVDFGPDYRILHDAGYHVLTYDERNSGHSGAANGGVNSGGRYEARDVVGSLTFARNSPDLRDLSIGLFSRCQGANASIFAMARHPEHFDGVRCMVAAQPLSVGVLLRQTLERLGLTDRIDDLDREVKAISSFELAEMSPVDAAKHVTVPTFLYQVRDDVLTRPTDVQAIFDNIPAEKHLRWILGTTRRWDGYLHFQREPEQVLEWFAKYLD
ncbi:alpha/beta hydrolase family protein [Umezawaea endophytica]|uniref:Lysophospholipase n=1 Tax=Umezawaea endophytica TaxID=1654476 RepID=A0A9X2VQP7_9PSEU|nr:lysophospholipase [Umezawaea endophytica]MCS7480427.1 lysophospholipase [Umezawaea endophytica]